MDERLLGELARGHLSDETLNPFVCLFAVQHAPDPDMHRPVGVIKGLPDPRVEVAVAGGEIVMGCALYAVQTSRGGEGGGTS